ncbi:putative steroid-binding protein 3 [Grifola frondosa]|uniref:Putative steroid-binding protein 3 n=1 Tax=Grifola frondosa TaxID=5627 RepID=A0A1C7M3P1_GRIFR|nr:putative steroid-binding protein 3 [Grifola frondosa]
MLKESRDHVGPKPSFPVSQQVIVIAMFAALVITFALALPFVYVLHSVLSRTAPPSLEAVPSRAPEEKPKSIMQPARTDLVPPKDDPFTVDQLKAFDGTDLSKPIYVAIKGTVFDVSHKVDTYGKGKSYNLFAGKDASRALGMSSLKEEDAVSDYSTLSESDLKTLNDWHDFFSKRYNIVGKAHYRGYIVYSVFLVLISCCMRLIDTICIVSGMLKNALLSEPCITLGSARDLNFIFSSDFLSEVKSV